MTNEKINKFLCEIYPADDKGDISAGTVIYFTGLWSILAIIILAIFGVLLTILGFGCQSALNNGIWVSTDEVTLMTPIYGFVFGVAMVLFCMTVDLLASIKVAHCPVKEKKEEEEEK